MELGAELACKLNGALGALVAGLGTAYERMVCHVWVFANLLFYALAVGCDYAALLAVYGNGQSKPLCLAEYLLQLLALVNEHVACA